MRSIFILNKEEFIDASKDNNQAWLKALRGTDNKNVKKALKKLIKKIFNNSEYREYLPLNTLKIINTNVTKIKKSLIPFMNKLEKEALPGITEEEVKSFLQLFLTNWTKIKDPEEVSWLRTSYFGERSRYELQGEMVVSDILIKKNNRYTKKFKTLITEELEKYYVEKSS